MSKVIEKTRKKSANVQDINKNSCEDQEEQESRSRKRTRTNLNSQATVAENKRVKPSKMLKNQPVKRKINFDNDKQVNNNATKTIGQSRPKRLIGSKGSDRDENVVIWTKEYMQKGVYAIN